jgi:hypothetical protein
VINARRNAGLLPKAEASPPSVSSPRCDPSKTQALGDALRGSTNNRQVREIFSAFLRDVADASRASGARAVLAIRGLAPRCPDDVDPAVALSEELDRQITRNGIELIDLDRNIGRVLAEEGHEMRELYGFGAALGDGHLNPLGHRVFAEALKHGLAPWLRGAVSRGGPGLTRE